MFTAPDTSAEVAQMGRFIHDIDGDQPVEKKRSKAPGALAGGTSEVPAKDDAPERKARPRAPGASAEVRPQVPTKPPPAAQQPELAAAPSLSPLR